MQNDREKEALDALEQLFDRRKRSSSSAYEERCYELRDIVSDALTERDRYKAVLEECREVLKTFAVVGKLIDGPFGPALFAEDGVAFSSGCAWIENGEAKTLTWGNFRRAASLIKKLDALSDNKDRAGW